MAINPVRIASISWIDEKSVPKAGFWVVAGASISWSNRVVMGLVGTSNPEPPVKLSSIAVFAASKEYRALLGCTVTYRPTLRSTDEVIDPGYTPPFDKSKLDTRLRSIAPIPEDSAYYAGEKSPLSGVSVGKLHASSTLTVPQNFKVDVSALIKFRAGVHTDSIGVEKAKSPVHVPWVWCEFALVSQGSVSRLLCNGSVFPSHAWYVDGKQVAKRLQDSVTTSNHDPILNVGQPANHSQASAESDKGAGPVSGQAYAVGAAKQIEVVL